MIAYKFDPVGNVTNRVITGLQGLTGSVTTRYQYDVMNRLTNVVQLTNNAVTASAWYSYDTAGRLWKKGYGNGDVVTHGYDTESRLLSLGITNATTPVWWWRYGWDNGGNILAITNNNTNVTLYAYDRAGQLTNEVCLTNGIAGGQTNRWVYDEAGNWLNAPQAGTRWVYDLDNELTGRVATNDPGASTLVTGQVEPGPNSNKWYNSWAYCRGVWGRVSTNDGTFSLPDVPLYPGTNQLVVMVRDVSGNEARESRTVIRTNGLEAFQYDGNGNLTNWVCGTTNWVYEWDWADRLTKVSSNGVVVLENWYDAYNLRVAKTELISGETERWLYLRDGWDFLAVLTDSGQLRETFTRGFGLAGDVGALLAVTHHAGSSSAGTSYTHHNHRGDVCVTRSGTATTGTSDHTAFGRMWKQTGTAVCRYTFSSKELEMSCGFSYFGYRWYAPNWQRWLSHDPERERGGIALFRYAGNNPVALIDPDGRFTQIACCAAWGLLGIVDIYREFQSSSCAGLSGGDFWACVIENVLAGLVPGDELADLMKCLTAAVAAPGSVGEKTARVADCLKCFGVDALLDAGKLGAMYCCVGPSLFKKPISVSPRPVEGYPVPAITY